MERMEIPKLRNDSKGGSNPDSLDCESGILPVFDCQSSLFRKHAVLTVWATLPEVVSGLIHLQEIVRSNL